MTYKHRSRIVLLVVLLFAIAAKVGAASPQSKGPSTESSSQSAAARLCSAIENGDRRAFDRLLKEGIDVNQASADGKVPLVTAAGWGDAPMVESLLDHGAKITLTDAYGETALDKSVSLGFSEVCRTLLHHHADPNAKCFDVPELFRAAIDPDVDVVSVLLDAGANINQLSNGSTALHIAVDTSVFRNVFTVRLLCSRGADLNIRDQDGQTALYLAVWNDNGMADLLLNAGADPNIPDKKGNTVLDIAASHHNVELIKRLLAAGASVDQRAMEFARKGQRNLESKDAAIKALVEGQSRKASRKGNETGTGMGNGIGPIDPSWQSNGKLKERK